MQMKTNSNSSIIFIYDELMTKDVQKTLGLELEFLCYAFTRGKMYWMNGYPIKRKKQKKYFYIPPLGKKRTGVVYGALFKINDWENEKLKYYAYYGSTIQYTESITEFDYYKPIEILCTPIKFKSWSDFKVMKFEKGKKVICTTFQGNEKNKNIERSIKKNHYYTVPKGLDDKSYIKLIKERNDENGLDRY